MARVRRPGSDSAPPADEGRAVGTSGPFGDRGPAGTQLAALLGARRFRLGPGAERVGQNLALVGGEVASDAAALITSARPPVDSPSISLGAHPGTLGPHSFGFLNNVGRVAAFDGPVPSLPRRGGVGLVVPGRDALPDLVPLCVARDLGVSFLVSAGDGDPAEALAFLGADPTTQALAVVLGPGARGGTLRGVLGAKPTVVWTDDPLCRAVARRAGAMVVDSLEAWLAHAALLDRALAPGGPLRVVVAGGGRAFVEKRVRAAGLGCAVQAVDERVPEELEGALREARAAGEAVVLVTGAPPPLPPPDADAPDDGPRVLGADLRHPEALDALLHALAGPPPDDGDRRAAGPADEELLVRVRAELDPDGEIGDHDAKRLLKAWGARVSRQAPAPTPTAATKLAKTIGLPVELVPMHGGARTPRVAETMPDVRQIATLLLAEAAEAVGPGEVASVLVREHFPESPRARVSVTQEPGLGLVLRIQESPVARRGADESPPLDGCALLPLSLAEAQALAAAAGARRAPAERALAELLGRISASADGERCELELELALGTDAAVVSARGRLRR